MAKTLAEYGISTDGMIPGSYAGYGSYDFKDSGGLLDGLLSGAGDLFGDADLGDWAGLASGLASMYMGNKQMGLYEDIMGRQLDMAEEKWGLTKEELARTKRVRQNLSGGYANNGNYAEQERRNPSEQPSAYGASTAYPVA